MRVLLIDPWGVANTSEYLNGLIYGLSKKTELTVFTNCYFELKVETNATINKIFFHKSEKMKNGKLRKILRGIEYIRGYRMIINYLKTHEKFDVIHINWLLMYSLDIYFLKILKKYTNEIVYTAHNVLPHISGEKYFTKLNEIYELVDRIILHGYAIKQEFEGYFPKSVKKIYIQKHGCNLMPSTGYDEKSIPDHIKRKLEAYEKKFIFFGNIFYNKGIDRIVRAWKSQWDDTLLIVAGKRDGEYVSLDELDDKLKNTNNILNIDGFVADNLLNYLISNSTVIVLPYRHASMSGVIFTAADFKKTVLCTNVGALPEYLEDGVDSFVVDNNDQAIINKLDKLRNFENDLLIKMGERLNSNIISKCSWEIVTSKLVDECY